MNEYEILDVIKNITGDKYIGDDCAYLKDLGIVVSQDSLVEGVHFDLKYTTPYQLGYKSIMVNISDIAASGGEAKYLSIALSLPKNISKDFIEEFYKGCLSASSDIEIIGGDITGSDKIMISISIIGITKNRRISSRKNAKSGDVIVASGEFGSSMAGLKLLQAGKNSPQKFIKSHLTPKAKTDFGKTISSNIDYDYSMMDTSDGLVNALYSIAKASNKTILLDFEKVEFDKDLKILFPDDYKNMVLYGGEDYQIVATVKEDFAKKYNLKIIGKVLDFDEVYLKIKDGDNIENIYNLDKCFNHFD